MARFNFEDADHYGGQGGGGYFSLKDDGDIAKVRFMYDTIDDLQGYSVHKVTIGDRDRYVNCPREYSDPIDNCPFCAANQRAVPKLFIPIYNLDTDRVEIWDRGKTYFQKLGPTFTRFAKDKPLCSTVFEIERHGKKNDQKTEYQWFNVDQDDTTLEDLPELPTIVGGLVLDKSIEDMECYVKHGYFPDDSEDEEPVRRRTSNDDNSGSSRTEGRRTPSRRESF